MARSKGIKVNPYLQIVALQRKLEFVRFQSKGAYLFGPLLGAWLGMRAIEIWLVAQGYQLNIDEWNTLSLWLIAAGLIVIFGFVFVGWFNHPAIPEPRPLRARLIDLAINVVGTSIAFGISIGLSAAI